MLNIIGSWNERWVLEKNYGNEDLGLRVGKKSDTSGGIVLRQVWYRGEAWAVVGRARSGEGKLHGFDRVSHLIEI